MDNQTASSSNSTICEEVLKLIPAYAFGAADPEESRFIEQHLHECPEALAELAAYGEIRDGMLFESPLMTAPSRLQERIAAIPNIDKSAPAAPLKLVERVKKPRTVNFAWAAAAAVILLVLSNLYWFTQVRSVESQQDNVLEEQRDVLAALSNTNAVQTQLISTANTEVARGVVWWSPGEQVALLRVDNLLETAQDQEYQLWLIEGDQPTSAGTFRVDEAGTSIFIFEPQAPITGFDVFGITLEPAGGSPAPTTSPILVGEI